MTTPKKTSLEKAPSAEMRPSWLPSGDTGSGTEHIGKDDISPPRLTVAQLLHDEMDAEHSKYLKELKETQMFNNMTCEIYGNELDVAIVRADPPRWIEFFPREDGGGVKEMNIKANDPRTRFADGKKPLAQKFYDYLVVLLPFTEDTIGERLLTLSFKSSGLKTAARLNYLIKMRRAPLFAGRYKLVSGVDRNKKGRFAVINVQKPAGEDGWVTEDEGIILCQTFESLRTTEVVFDRETDAEHNDNPDGARDASGSQPPF